MCIVCVELAKGTLKRSEAKRALAEVAMDPKQLEHAQDVFRAIEEEERKVGAENRVLPLG